MVLAYPRRAHHVEIVAVAAHVGSECDRLDHPFLSQGGASRLQFAAIRKRQGVGIAGMGELRGYDRLQRKDFIVHARIPSCSGMFWTSASPSRVLFFFIRISLLDRRQSIGRPATERLGVRRLAPGP